MMKTILTSPDGPDYDRFREKFRTKTDAELSELYFIQQKVGITGVRMQAYYLAALRAELLERFGDSPIEYDGTVLEL